jgi:predicted dehydrogenase
MTVSMGYTVAVVGTGADPDDPDTDGYAMAYRHAKAYKRLDECTLTACADIIPENAERFAEHWDIPPENVFEDASVMLDMISPDVISVCVPPHVHAPVVTECAKNGDLQAIHCEKPMATSWSECQEMASACDRANIQLTFNHQRRFGGPFREAKSLLDDGRIGKLQRIELGGEDLFDYGSHLFDLCGYFTDQVRVEWVMSGIDYSEKNVKFGAHNENQAIAQWRYRNGVYGVASTGRESLLSSQMRLVGRDGIIEIGADDTPLRLRNDGNWQTVATDGDGIHGPKYTRMDAIRENVFPYVPFLDVDTTGPSTFIERAIDEVITALEENREPEVSAANALQATELIFACWESARRRGRVDLPLDISDNPLESMVEDGSLLTGETS